MDYFQMNSIVWSSHLDTITSIFSSPLLWWVLIVISLLLINTFELGPHCFSWPCTRKKLPTKSHRNCSIKTCDSIDGPNGITPPSQDVKCRACDSVKSYDNNDRVPFIFHKFIQTEVIPNFALQCRDGADGKFAVLVFSRINSLREIERVKFNQITFNGKPLVDSRLITYPEKYRYENYIVARSNTTDHPESLIVKQVPALLAAYGKRERCYMKNPKPKFVLLYSWAMPCASCTDTIIGSLSGVCGGAVPVVAYSQLLDDRVQEEERNSKSLTDAGFRVVRVESH